MRLALLVLVLASAPTAAMAQPVFVESATLRVGHQEVGWLRSGPSMITGWQADQVDLHFEDDVIAIDARIDLSVQDNALLVTPGQPVTLEPTRAFTVEMLPRTFARIVGRDAANRLRIRLPDTLPHRVASMPLGSAVMPISTPAAVEAPFDDWESICRPTRVYSRPSSEATVWIVDGPSTRAEVGPVRHGFRPVRVWIDGYIVHGFLDHPLPTHVGCGGGSYSSSCGGIGVAVRTSVIVPAGTALFGSATAPERFAMLRIPYVATMIDAGPIPDAPTAWRITRDEADRPRWSLEVWLRTGAETLRGYPSPPPSAP
jgi:hypothetical protein